MTIFYQRTPQEIRENFTHQGWFFLCPVYIAHPDSQAPWLESRNWIPEWWLLANTVIAQAVGYVMSRIDPDFEPMFAISLQELPPLEDK